MGYTPMSDRAAHLLLILLLEGRALPLSRILELSGWSSSTAYRAARELLDAGHVVSGGYAMKEGGGREAIFSATTQPSTPTPPTPSPAVYHPPTPPQRIEPVAPTPAPTVADLARAADEAHDSTQQRQALARLWQELFPASPLRDQQAADLLVLSGGSAALICEALPDAVQNTKEKIGFPLGFAKAVVRSRKQRADGGGGSVRGGDDYSDEYMTNLLAFQKDVYTQNKEEGRLR